MSAFDHLRYFRAEEFAFPDRMQPQLLHKLDQVREHAGVPIIVTSSLRDGDDGAHGDGTAVDISDNKLGGATSSGWRYRVLRAAFVAGFERIGVYDRHIHLDLSARDDHPTEVAWWGSSKCDDWRGAGSTHRASGSSPGALPRLTPAVAPGR